METVKSMVMDLWLVSNGEEIVFSSIRLSTQFLRTFSGETNLFSIQNSSTSLKSLIETLTEGVKVKKQWDISLNIKIVKTIFFVDFSKY